MFGSLEKMSTFAEIIIEKYTSACLYGSNFAHGKERKFETLTLHSIHWFNAFIDIVGLTHRSIWACSVVALPADARR